MNKPFNNQTLKSVWTTLKPWVSGVAIILVLKFTGALSGISFFTQSALMKAGVFNFDPAETIAPDSFVYDFNLKDIHGNSVDFNYFKGKVVFLNLWATWCGPCRVEMPSIHNLYNSVDKEKIVFVMLSLDTQENHHKIVKYIEDKGFTFPVYTPAGYLPKHLQVPTIPTTFIISKDGKVKTKKVGTANYDTDKFRAYLKELAAEE